MKGCGKKNALEQISVSSNGIISIDYNLSAMGGSVADVKASCRATRVYQLGDCLMLCGWVHHASEP